MLAFITTTIQIPGQPRIDLPYLAIRFREACCAIEARTPEVRTLILWLKERWQSQVPDLEWTEAQGRLEEIMWINAIHDKPGKKAFEFMRGRTSKGTAVARLENWRVSGLAPFDVQLGDVSQ